jgi:hypothetical protein
MTFLLFLFGAAIALIIPDIDQRIPFLVHRSLLTHGMLLPVLAYWIARRAPITHRGAIGVCTATAVHLAFDLFPRLWIGFALIHAPVLGRFPPVLSIAWLAISLVVCCYLALALVRNAADLGLVALGLAASFVLLAPTEVETRGPFLALVAALALVLVLPDRLPTLRSIARG